MRSDCVRDSFFADYICDELSAFVRLVTGREAAIADFPTVVKKDMCENGYSQRFAVSGNTMYKVALVFSSEGKGLLGWKVNLGQKR